MEGHFTNDTENVDSGSYGAIETLPHEAQELLANLPVTPNVEQVMRDYHLPTTRVHLGGELAVRVSDMPPDQFDSFIAPVLDETILLGDDTARKLWLPRLRLAAINQALRDGKLRKFAVAPWGYLLIPVLMLLSNYWTP